MEQATIISIMRTLRIMCTFTNHWVKREGKAWEGQATLHQRCGVSYLVAVAAICNLKFALVVSS